MRALINRDSLDRVGSCLSAACAIHCTAKPFLFVLPSIAWLDFIMSPQFEGVLLTSGVLLALTGVTWGYTRHEDARVFLSLLVAFGLIGIGRLAVPHGWLERILVIPGGLIIALTHLINARLCACCET